MYTRCCALCVSCYACRAATTAALVSAFGYGSTAAIATSFELRELLALCLKRIRGLKSLSRISDCRWLYSEPHSNKLLLRLTARADVLEGKAEVEQSFNVSGLVHNMQCDECKQAFTPHAGWGARVQVRQRCDHKRTFLFLEQLLLQQHNLLQKLLRVVQRKDGLDFYFPNKQAAASFVSFCSSRLPCSSRSSKRLISHDCNSNTYIYKHTVYVELPAICRDDLVYIPAKKAQDSFGGFPSLSLCTRVSSTLHLTDPFSGRHLDMAADVYFRDTFKPICTRKHLSHFLILAVTPLEQTQQQPQQKQQHGKRHQKQQNKQQQRQEAAAGDDAMTIDTNAEAAGAGTGRTLDSATKSSSSGSSSLVEVELLRCSASGVPEGEPLTTVSHLGALLHAGDFAAGYDLQRINLSGFVDDCLDRDLHWPSSSSSSSGCEQQEGLAGAPWPVMLVKRHYPFRKTGRRQWVLRTLQKHEEDGTGIEEDGEVVGAPQGPESSAEGAPHRVHGMHSRKKRGASQRRGAAAAEDEDMEEFRKDLEEDAELRKQVLLYKDPRISYTKATGAAKVRAGSSSSSSKQQQGLKRREANKARKLAEAHDRARQQQQQEREGDEGDSAQSDSEQDAGSGPVIDISELLEGLSLEDLEPVQLGQGNLSRSADQGPQPPSDEEDTL
ncbi:NMD3 protein, putative [Eimeria necatrix]|uniref:60S ribosomal export protein NMD3 n=1 Tax=Eimeria necatrix TaxID=51315 RepID=U6MN85_9EIME|nr:NMD3 protein, putative [Eimeria necatrix]CDJ65672.1 NMD3 protein, putative [Eimeria necatrix]